MARTAKKKKNMKGRKRGGASVPCPRCHKDSRVIITRRVSDEVLRNRVCKSNHAFTTVESVQAD